MEDLLTGFTSLKKVSLTDQIHDRILEMIIKNPSTEEQILNERRLMERFGVSKAPVREALIRLCSEGVLISVPRFGYMVVQMQEKDYEDIKNMRIMLETEALRISFPQISRLQLEQIQEQIVRAAEKKDVDVWKVWEDNEEFHMLLASFSENKILIKFLRQCMEMDKRIYAQKIWRARSSMDDSVVGTPHQDIYHKLCEGDLERTIQLLCQDIRGL
jgi:DNA-binding GntR family transcriptional regulator